VSNLLQVNRVHPKALSKEGNVPLMMEFPVHEELAPYLVSSSKAVLWVEEAHPGDPKHVKAAVRTIKTPGNFFWELTEALIERGSAEKWGSVHPFCEKGVRDAIAHLHYYDLTDLELLVPRTRVADASRDTDKEAYERPDWLTQANLQLPLKPSGWAPDNCAIAVPRDRSFVGVLLHLAPKSICAAIHNASRGVAIAVADGFEDE